MYFAAIYHLLIPGCLPAVPPLGYLLPLSVTSSVEGRGDTACSARRCKAKPLRSHGLQHRDVCQESCLRATLSCRHSSGNTKNSHRSRFLDFPLDNEAILVPLAQWFSNDPAWGSIFILSHVVTNPHVSISFVYVPEIVYGAFVTGLDDIQIHILVFSWSNDKSENPKKRLHVCSLFLCFNIVTIVSIQKCL